MRKQQQQKVKKPSKKAIKQQRDRSHNQGL